MTARRSSATSSAATPTPWRLSIAAPLVMSLLGKTAQSQQVQAQPQASGNFTPFQTTAQPVQQASGLNVGSIMSALLKNVDVGKILLSLLK